MEKLQKKIDDLILKIKENEIISNTNILNEEKSPQFCSYDEQKEIAYIFNTHPKVKWTFRDGIDQILKRVFADKWKDDEQHPKGVYDLEEEGRSVINKLNTNYSCFCILMKDINKVLVVSGLSPLKIVGASPNEQINETKKMINLIDKFAERIFNPNSRTFISIMSTLQKTHSLGEKRENVIVTMLEKIFGKGNVKKIGGMGSKEDMISGVDHIIIKDGVEYTAQTKPMADIELQNDFYTIFGSGGVKKYKTDWMIFEKSNQIYVFENNKTQIIDGNYVFPKSSLIYSL